MIIPETHLIFDLIFDLILFNFRFNFHIGTTPKPARRTESAVVEDLNSVPVFGIILVEDGKLYGTDSETGEIGETFVYTHLEDALKVLATLQSTSRRAAACGRAQLLAKKRHTGRVQNPAKVSENRPACGTAQHTLAVCFVFEKLQRSRKKLVKIWRILSKI